MYLFEKESSQVSAAGAGGGQRGAERERES